MKSVGREALADGQTYQNKRGDFRGPMDERMPGMFLDQYGMGYSADGIQWNHLPASTANIDLTTAGTTEGWRDESAYVRDGEAEFEHACKQEEDERRDEAELLAEAKAALSAHPLSGDPI